jgi:hypothetical protein
MSVLDKAFRKLEGPVRRDNPFVGIDRHPYRIAKISIRLSYQTHSGIVAIKDDVIP